MIARRAAAVAAMLVAALTIALPAAAASEGARRYVLAVGYNGVPADGDASLRPLRFADDDAIAFFTFASHAARRGYLLTIVDEDTQRRLGTSVPTATPPTVEALRNAVAQIRAALDEDARAKIPTTVYLYYSGHGSAPTGREPSLSLLDGALTRAMLYDEVLAKLPATHVHLFVDACHAEAVVRPRDTEARDVPIAEEDRTNYALATTLARFPSAGAVMAATRSAQAHEWEAYLGGVFTHELLSGLRGAADVNGDERIEYSELAAFLSAANRAVADPRARLETVTHAPTADPRAAIVELTERDDEAVLESHARLSGTLFVEDERGDRLADVRPEVGHPLRLLLPADRTWYVHTPEGEAEVRPKPGTRVSVQSLNFKGSPTGARGALEAALHAGLFATPFGPSYYQGFVDRETGLVPVPLPSGSPLDARDEVHFAGNGADAGRVWGWTGAGTAAALLAGASAFGWMALQDKADVDGTTLERRATDAAGRYTRDTALAASLGGGAIVVGALAVYLLVQPRPDVPTHAGFDLHGLRVDF